MAEIKAVLFDQDGVIIDTERDGHRVSFNMTFKEFGYNFEWGVDEITSCFKSRAAKSA
jgi:phosphoglycolate phosphatase-like HAD superfamily hydrolase